MFSPKSLWNLLSKNENVFSDIHSQVSCKTQKSSSWCFKDCIFQKCTFFFFLPSTISHSLVVEQFSYPVVGNQQMVRWENGKRSPSLAIWKSSQTQVSKGRKHHIESINYMAGKKETLISYTFPYAFILQQLKKNLLAKY